MSPSDDSEIKLVVAFPHIIYFIVFACKFWNSTVSELYIGEVFMLYLWWVIIPVAVIIISFIIFVVILN